MGLLNTVFSTIRGDAGASSSSVEQVALLPVLVDYINSHPGGLPALLEKFRADGLGEAVASWLGNGRNLPVSPDQLRSALGDAAVNGMATSSGQAPDALLSNLSALLPVLVDHVTPDGQATQFQPLDATALLGGVSGLLSKL